MSEPLDLEALEAVGLSYGDDLARVKGSLIVALVDRLRDLESRAREPGSVEAVRMVNIHTVRLKSREEMGRTIPRELWGWWHDVCPGQSMVLRDATAADLARCRLPEGDTRGPADFLCELPDDGSLVSREAIEFCSSTAIPAATSAGNGQTDAALTAQQPKPSMGAAKLAVELRGVAETVAKGSGFWTPCTGCYDTEDGRPTQRYAHSDVFGCELGNGCSECGGLGVVWDDTDYEAMADSVSGSPSLATPPESLEDLTPNQRRALGKALSALETMAAIWGAEIRISEVAQKLASKPDAERARAIAAFIEQAFIEGAYRHYLDRDPAACKRGEVRGAEHEDIGRLLHQAATQLPEGWEIEVRIERGWGGVRLHCPKGETLDLDDGDTSLSKQIEGAVDAARRKASIPGLLKQEPAAAFAVPVTAANVDERVPPAAMRADEVDAEVVNAGLNGAEGNLDAASNTDPHRGPLSNGVDLHDRRSHAGVQAFGGAPAAAQCSATVHGLTVGDRVRAITSGLFYGPEEAAHRNRESVAVILGNALDASALDVALRHAIEQVEGALELCESDDAEAFQLIKRALLSMGAVTPVPQVAGELPERVIDVLWQQAGLTSFHPDGDQQAKFHMFANLITIELRGRTPAAHAAVAIRRRK